MIAVPISHKFHYFWSKIAFFLLLAHSAYGLWESFRFLLFEWPHLEEKMSAHLLTAAEVSEITISGIVLMVATFVTIAMAMRLHSTREEVANTFDLIIATLIVVLSPFAQDWLAKLPWMVWLSSLL